MQSEKEHDILKSVQDATRMMRNIAYHYASSYDDLYQVAAEKAVRVYDRAQETPNPAAYLHRAIRNAILDYVGATRISHRKQTLADHYLIESLDAPLADDDDAFSLQDIVSADTQESSEECDFSRLYAVLEALPKIYREVIYMHFGLCGYGVHRDSDIAAMLGVSHAVIRTRLCYAKAMLRQYRELLDLVESQV